MFSAVDRQRTNRFVAALVSATLMLPLGSSAAGAATPPGDVPPPPTELRVDAATANQAGLNPAGIVVLGLLREKCRNAMYPGRCDGPVH